MPEFRLDVNDLPEVSFQKGDTILEEGKAGSVVYVLKEGAVSVRSGGVEICRVNHPMTVLGEISVLLSTEHTATVVALDESTFYVINDLVAFVHDHPEAGLHISSTLATRIVNMNLAFLEFKDQVERLKDRNERAAPPNFWDHFHVFVRKLDRFWSQDVF